MSRRPAHSGRWRLIDLGIGGTLGSASAATFAALLQSPVGLLASGLVLLAHLAWLVFRYLRRRLDLACAREMVHDAYTASLTVGTNIKLFGVMEVDIRPAERAGSTSLERQG